MKLSHISKDSVLEKLESLKKKINRVKNRREQMVCDFIVHISDLVPNKRTPFMFGEDS